MSTETREGEQLVEQRRRERAPVVKCHALKRTLVASR
jgi:hypothetical protein